LKTPPPTKLVAVIENNLPNRMNRETIDKIISEILQEKLGKQQGHLCCKDGICSDGLCVVHNKEGVRAIVNGGAARITAGVGVDGAGGVEPELAGMIDHTMLKPEATTKEIETMLTRAFPSMSPRSAHGVIPESIRLRHDAAPVGDDLHAPFGLVLR
jgi:hypothetical protein